MNQLGKHLIFHQDEWLDWSICDHQQIASSHKILKVLVDRHNEKDSDQSSYRSILSAITGDSLDAYNEARKAYVQARREGLRRLEFMRHVLPLELSTYPEGWRITAPQTFIKDPQKNNKTILICFTGQSGMMDMPIPCFHSIAHHLFDAITYIYDPEKNRYLGSLHRLVETLQELSIRLDTDQIYFAGVSDGGAAALWMNFQIQKSKGVLSTSPTITDFPGLVELLAAASEKKWQAIRIFFSTGNAIDWKNHHLLAEALDTNVLAEQVFNLNWASSSHASMGTLMSLGCMGDQLLWLRSQNSATARIQ